MTLEELFKELGLNPEVDEDKPKIALLKKEFNSKDNEIKTSNKKITGLEKEIESMKDIVDKFEVTKKFFDLDVDTDDFDSMLDDIKDNIIKEAGGGVTPEDVKGLKRELSKANREKDKITKAFDELNTRLLEEKALRVKNNIRTEIRTALDRHKVIKPEQMIDLFASRVVVDNDNETFTIKGSDGSELSVADYVADWCTENPEFVLSGTKGGAGTNGSVNQGSGNTPKSDVDIMMKDIMDTFTSNEPKDLGTMFG